VVITVHTTHTPLGGRWSHLGAYHLYRTLISALTLIDPGVTVAPPELKEH